MVEKEQYMIHDEVSEAKESVENCNIESFEMYPCEAHVEQLFSFNICNFLKGNTNEKEINDIVEVLNDKIKGLNNYINKITKERYEYFYKYVDDIEKIKKKQKKKKKKWNVITRKKEEFINYCVLLKGNKNNLMNLIQQKKCLTEIEKVLKLYLIVEDELEKISNDLSENKNLEMVHLFKNEDSFANNSIDDNKYCSPIYDSNSFFDDFNFEAYFQYLIKLHNLYTFIKINDIENFVLCQWKIKRINHYKQCIINIFIKFLSGNFTKEENYEWSVKQCINSFVLLNIEKDCLNQICVQKIKDANYLISKIKKKKYVKENFFLVIKKCKEDIQQLIFINEMLKEVYSSQGRYATDKNDMLNVDSSRFNVVHMNTKKKQLDKKRTMDALNIHDQFYEPYVNMLIEQEINTYLDQEDILYAINLVEEFFHLIKGHLNVFNVKRKSNDLILHLFKKKYEEITFNSINKLTNIVELLFQKKGGTTSNENNLNTCNAANLKNNKIFDYEEEYNFPTASDIKNYVSVIYKELFTYIFYPYIFRKIIFSCNNSLLLLSNNLNNLKQNIQFRFDLNIQNKDINCLYNYKKFYYNLELFLLSKKILKYLLLHLKKLKRKIVEIKGETYRNYYVLFEEKGEMLDPHLEERSKAEKQQFIRFSFKESFNKFFSFQDYLDNVFFDPEEKTERREFTEGNKTNEANAKDELDRINKFQLHFISDVIFDGLCCEGYGNIGFGNTENYEVTSFFIKEKGKSKLEKRECFFDLIELEKGICELNNAAHSFILESFDVFEKKVLSFIKENYNMLSNINIYTFFDQLCSYFYSIIIQKIPFEEIKQIVINLINRIIIFIICYSAFYLVEGMEIYIFTYLKSLMKLTNEEITPSEEILACLKWEHKLCALYKASVEMKNDPKKEESFKTQIPSYFLPVTFIILYDGSRIVKYFNELEEKFLNIMINSIKSPLHINKKNNSLKLLLFMLNDYAKNVLAKNGSSAA